MLNKHGQFSLGMEIANYVVSNKPMTFTSEKAAAFFVSNKYCDTS